LGISCDAIAEKARQLTSAQWFALAGCAAILVWSIPGLIVNPDFAVGSAATSKVVLGVDMNGWHAVSGFLIIVPVLVVLFNEELFPWVMAAATFALYGTAVWAALSDRPAAGLFYFPHPTGDTVLHIATGTIFLIGTVLAFREPEPAVS
jgi:hypothetical protein